MRYLTIQLLLIATLSSCGIADLRHAAIKKNEVPQSDFERGRQLLAKAVTRQGIDQTDRFTTYEAIASDHWKGIMGQMGKIWDWQREKMALRFSLGDFDGQVEVLEGKNEGFVAGIQSWDYYEKQEGTFNSDIKDDKRVIFGLAAYHYFFELGNRLQTVPYIVYQGRDELDGKDMEKVFVSWGDEKTRAYDQYVLWIGRESGLIEAATYTIRDNYLPMSGFLAAAVRFTDFRDVEGVMIPFRQTIQLSNPKDKLERYVHTLTLESFRWDAVTTESLRPLPGIPVMGDEKPTK